MPLPTPNNFYTPTAIDLRESMLRTLRGTHAARGIVANTLPNSEYWHRATAIGRIAAIAFANNKIAAAQANPRTATGQQLIDLAATYGITSRPAAPATGYATVVVSSGAVILEAGKFAVYNGRRYNTVSANTVVNDSAVALTAVDGGASTDVAPGTVLTWEDASNARLSKNLTVDSAGLTGGADADTEEVLRQRLLERLAFPLGGGNWAQVKALAENASASVSTAYVYQAARGPSSLDVAVVRDTGDRTLSNVVTAQVAAAIVAELPGSQSINVTSVTASQLDILLTASLPLPVNAGGAGGGWRDATPWPNATSGNVKVNSYDSGTGTITTDAAGYNGLVIGSSIAIWDPTAEVMREYVASLVAIAGTVTIQVEGGFATDHTGAYISAGAVNMASYGTTYHEAFRAMGPGEKTTNTNIVPRALRKPSPDISGPANTSSLILSAVSNAHPEVGDLAYSQRYVTGTTTTKTAPAAPATTSLPPEQLVLKHLSIRQA